MTKQNERALVVLSGGQDSTTCLYWAKERFKEVHAITFEYGQRHKIELDAASRISRMAGTTSHKFIKLGDVLESTSPLVSDNELEQYADHQSLPGGLEKTFVPMRNQMFLTIAANRAFAINASNLVTGVCQEDFGGYPDCRQSFIDEVQNACNEGTFTEEAGFPHGLKIHTPLMNLTKAESVHLAKNFDGCYGALAFSHTSYDGQYPPLGKDHATLLREKGFEEAGIPDPLIIRAYIEGLMELPDHDIYRLNNDFGAYKAMVRKAMHSEAAQ